MNARHRFAPDTCFPTIGSETGFGIDRLSRIGVQPGKMSAVTDNMFQVQDTSLTLETIRRAGFRYRIDSDPAALKAMQDGMTEATEPLRQSAAATLSEDRRRIDTAVREDARTYRTLAGRPMACQTQIPEERKKLFTGGDALTIATGRLVQTAETAEDAVLTHVAASVERAVLLTRVANGRFLTTNDANGSAIFKTNRRNADTTIATLDQVSNDATRAMTPPVRAACTSVFDRATKSSWTSCRMAASW